MPTSTPTISQLERALEIAKKIQELEDELQAVMAGGEHVPMTFELPGAMVKRRPGRPPKSAGIILGPSTPVKRGGKRTFSAESRAKMAAAQRARWAGKTASTTTVSAPNATKAGKRTMSPEVRARLAAAMKARWAAAKKSGKAINARK